MMSRLCGEVPPKSPDVSAKNRDGRLLGSAAPRNNTPCIRTEVCGVPAAYGVEPLECLYLGLQELDAIPQFKATAELGEFLEARFAQSL